MTLQLQEITRAAREVYVWRKRFFKMQFKNIFYPTATEFKTPPSAGK
jgi:hypothetical protein